MIDIPQIKDLEITGKKVIVRADLDVEPGNTKELRLRALLPTLEVLFQEDCEIVLIGHRGRPDGVEDANLSLQPVSATLEEILREEWGSERLANLKMNMLENLRFSPGEEANDAHFSKHLAEYGELFINEAFSNSHRNHASIVGLPKILPHAAGMRFYDELKHLSYVRETAEKPVVTIIGGVKKDKLDYIEAFKTFSDKILIAGRLPEYMPEDINDEKLIIGKLLPDKEDITIHTIEKFEEAIEKAKTIIVAGPIGKYEEEGHRMGTERVLNKVASSQAHKIVGGGDSVTAVIVLGLQDSFNWVSVGGGAMLDFLADGNLPGIEALK